MTENQAIREVMLEIEELRKEYDTRMYALVRKLRIAR